MAGVQDGGFGRPTVSASANTNMYARQPSSPSTSSMIGKRKRGPDDMDLGSSSDQPTSHDGSSTPGHNHTPLFSSPSGSTKRVRALPQGRPLPLDRLLDDLDRASLKRVLYELCARHPGLQGEVYKVVSPVTVSDALAKLHAMERGVNEAFPLGGDRSGEYAYNRVLPRLRDLQLALSDYLSHFLSTATTHPEHTFDFLDAATAIVTRFPHWANPNHNLAKREAVEELGGAWQSAFRLAVSGVMDGELRGTLASGLDRLRLHLDPTPSPLREAFNAITELFLAHSHPSQPPTHHQQQQQQARVTLAFGFGNRPFA
ncbi:Tethering factor for nuclear proteasome sts1 [Savitreella phatthalungensis]